MHFIVKATLPIDAGNRMIKDGSLQATFEKIMADARPEQVYFSVAEGQRTIFMIVDLPNPTDMVRVGEPLWLGLEADVEVFPAMTSEEFATIGPALGQIVSKY